ncbi:hypothetical protein ACF09Y_09440 [Streptomyces massasporeus]|uniref:hypothetical protein n=1 Tax=Streptomyces massasporeus TaxID=67324 RepID=UPI0036FB9D75
MTDHLDLRIGFEPELPGLYGGDHTFGCVAQNGYYPLPTVVLLTRDGQLRAFPKDLAVTGTADGPPAARQWLENAWTPAGPLFPPGHPVHGRATAVSGLWLPCDVVHGPGPQDPVRMQVHWRLVFADEHGTEHQDYATVTLVFGSTEPQHSRPELKGLPRHIGDDTAFRDFAAIDFGTTSSTVTLYNADEVTIRPIDHAQEQAFARCLATVMDGTAQPPHGGSGAPAGWRAEAARIAATVLGTEPGRAAGDEHPAPDAVARLCELLRRPSPDPGLIAAAGHALELSARGKGGPWAVHGLQTAYEQAFRVPPLSRLGLSQVSFSGVTRTYEVASALSVRDSALHLADEQAGAVRNLKRMLRRPGLVPVPALGPDVAHLSDDLVALAFVRFVEAAEPEIRNPQTGEPRRLVELVVTSPTTTPPDARARLTKLLAEQVDISGVVTDYDEGVSAGLFHLMRDFSGDAGAGVESLRARAHPVAGTSRPTWFHTVLIIDVGGGTTDIALLGLTLTELTDELPEEDRPHGRTYELRPEVLGSTGHPDLGGDYLTLRVYYLLKATLVDAFLRLAHARSTADETGGGSDPGTEMLGLLPQEFAPTVGGPGSLAAEVVDHLSARDLPRLLVRPEVRQVLTQILPTGWEESDAHENALFHLLWAEAEQAKFRLGTENGEAWKVSTTAVDSWLRQLPQDGADAKRHRDYLLELVSSHTPGEFLRLRPEDFRRIAEPVFQEAAAVALDIVQSRFERDERKLVLDRVLLSGRSTVMPVAEETVTLALATERRPDGSPLFENIRSVRAEPVYAKQATSLGAAWAHSRSRTRLRRGGAKDIGGSGGATRVDIYAGDLSPTLPCDFEVLGPDNRPAKVLGVGEPYESLPDGAMVVRTGWGPPERMLNLLRPLNKEVKMNWAHFGVEREAVVQGVRLDPDLWWGRIADGVHPLVRMQIEVGQQLAPRVHYRLGDRAHLVVTGAVLDLVAVGLVTPDVDGLVLDLALGLSVHGVTRQGKRTERVTVLDASVWPTEERFPAFFHESQDLDAPGGPVPGVLLPFTAPRPADDYVVEAILQDGSRVELGRLPVPPRTRHEERHTLTLDGRGRIRVHRAVLPYLEAKDVRTMQDRPGSVYSAPMRQDLDSLFPDWSPFHGRH